MSKRWVSAMAASATAAAALVASPALAQSQVPASAAENGRLWFVELAGEPESEGRARSEVKSDKDNYRRAASAAGVRWKERRSYDKLFNGFAVEVEPAERSKLARIPGFKAMYPIFQIQAPKPEFLGGGAAPDLATAISMTGANVAQASGWTGAGIKVGIIDTGIDIDHPDLGGRGTPGSTPFPSARVVAGYDFVGDAFNADDTSPAFNPVATPDNNPDDCNGHGTHVAGIVGANGAVKGVAPGVSFGAYRVFGCDGSTTDDIILAALERALDDGMHVVNQSLGASRQWPQYPTAVASSRLAKKGVVMVASIGNSGPQGSAPDGLYAAGAPGVGAGVIGVASFDNLQSTKFSFTVTPGGNAVGYLRATAAPPSPFSGSLPMSRTGTPTSAADACTTLPAGSLAGTAALVRRGGCTFAIKSANAQAAGAAAVVLYNNAAGDLGATVAGGPAPITIPVVGITRVDGEAIDAKIAAGATSLNWSSATVVTPLASAGLISGFSSFGLAADLTLKPNLGAPGGSIYSTYPLEQDGYASLSGTSMSSPHVAGAAALLLQARPKTKVDEVKRLLQNTADPKNWSLGPNFGLLDHVHRQGAGMIDIPQAIASTTTVEPSEIALGESAARNRKVKLKIRNEGNASVTYTIGHQAGLATAPGLPTLSGTFVGEIGFYDAPATVTAEKTTVRVRARDSEEVELTITAPADYDAVADTGLPERGLYGGYVVLTPQGGGQPLRVPYAGFKGDYQAIQVLKPTPAGFPWLAKLTNGNLFNQPAGASYSLVGADIPFFLMHLDHHSEEVLLEAVNAVTGKVVGKVSDDQWVTRNTTATGFFAFTWDGQVFKKDPAKPNNWSTAPNGQYVVRVTVRKALADKNNPAHFESWTSPVITLARP